MVLTAVSANLGCEYHSPVLERRREAAVHWGQQERDRGTDLVFVQEIPGECWLATWREAGYETTTVDGPTFRVRSAVVWKPPIRRRQILAVAEDYHGSYVASVGLELPGHPTPIAALSVHTRSRVVLPLEFETYQAWDIGTPIGRRGGGPDDCKLFDADMLLHTLKVSRLVHPRAGFMVAGDFNECLGWDADHDEARRHLYFEKAREYGLTPVRCSWTELWKGERRTQSASGKPPYQLDHLLVTPDIAALICDSFVEPWDLEQVEAGERSDHAPIRFKLCYEPLFQAETYARTGAPRTEPLLVLRLAWQAHRS